MHVVIGQGPLGAEVAAQLSTRGEEVRVLTRSGTGGDEGAVGVAVDAGDVDALAAACRGAEVMYSCASPPYHRWAQEFPALAEAVLGAAERTGAVLVIASNLYGYGPASIPLTEGLPLAATGPKGRIRAAIWEGARAAMDAGRVRVTEARASDFFGPRVTSQGHLAERVVPRLFAGKGVRVLGDPEAAHSWSYLPDVASTLIQLGSDSRAWGSAWHVPTAAPDSARAMVDRMAGLAGLARVPVGTAPWGLLRAMALVTPPLRGMDEIRYQFDEPFTVDSAAYTAAFGQGPTDTDTALATTLDWWRGRQAAAA